MSDLATFAASFLLVWGGLAAYLVWLHRRLAALERRR